VDVCKQTSFFNSRELDVQGNPIGPTDECGRTTDLNTMVSPSQKGERSEAAILYALVASGRVVLMPWGASQRYDFVIDEGDGRFTRVQCKSGVYRHGCVYFRTASADRRRPNGDPYVGQIDAFAVHCHELDTSFLVPIEHIQARQVAALRIDPPANGQTFAIRWANPYLLGRGRSAVTSHQPLLERKTGFEPATPILARLCATTAPLPLDEP
jgi:hypothetical protein